MKKVLTALLLLLLILMPAGEAEARTPRIWVNGRYIESDAQPFIYNNRTMLPVRSVSEALGSRVIWRPEDRAVMIADYDQIANGNCVSLRIGDHNIYGDESGENPFTPMLRPLFVTDAHTFPFGHWPKRWMNPCNGTDAISPSPWAGAIPLS